MRSPASAPISMRMPLLLVIIAFIVLKIPHLSYPFYWDESWPYASAVRAMYMHGPGLAPWAIPPDLSRGHPLLFHFLAASWMNIFGASNVAMHAFSLSVSLTLLICAHELTLRMFGIWPAITAVLLLGAQEMFFVQSSFLLPEVLLALFSLLSIFSYASRKYLACTLLATALLFTKESGLVLTCIFAVDAFVALFSTRHSHREKLGRTACAGVPLFIYGMFLLAQKHSHGWYFYPLHTSLLEQHFDGFWYRFRYACSTHLFAGQYRYLYFFLLAAAAIIKGISGRNATFFALPFFVTFSFCLLTGRLPGRVPSLSWCLFFVGAWLLATWSVGRSMTSAGSTQRRFVTMSSCFVLCFLIFSAANFYTVRYLIAPLTMLLILVPALLNSHLPCPRLNSAMLSIILLSTSLVHYHRNHGHGDTELGAFDAMKMQQAVADFLEINNYRDSFIASGSFLQAIHLTVPSTGFLRGSAPFPHVKWDINDSTRFVIFDSLEPDDRRGSVKQDTRWQLVLHAAFGNEWGEVYARR